MRFMMLVKADKRSEAGMLPTAADLAVMGQFNEELVKAGVLLDGAGLHPSSKGAKITFVNGKPQVTDGPFAETKELISGYWIIQVNSREEALEWAKKAPFDRLPSRDGNAEIEMRQMFDLEDFPEVPPGVAELENKLKR